MAATAIFVRGFTAAVEGPACDLEGRVYAANYGRDGTIARVEGDGTIGHVHALELGSEGCGMVFGPGEELYVAEWRTHRILALDTTKWTARVHAHEPAMNQPNDLAVCADGTLFASDPDWDAGTGQLWRIAADGSTTLIELEMGTTNGIEVSPDERTLYVNESVQRRVWAYELGADRVPRRKRLLAEFDEFLLDGMRCDLAGAIYVTRFGAGLVAILAPDGRVSEEIELQGRDCTNVAFGGADGRTLFVTVADTGCIETARVGVAGRSNQLLQGWRDGTTKSGDA